MGEHGLQQIKEPESAKPDTELLVHGDLRKEIEVITLLCARIETLQTSQWKRVLAYLNARYMER
jgi:hypothetical protein